ncbi:helix-turn-helix transcriptional regulator [Tumebacillus flagellatus]|uniref:HTH cro/C1-type domain-containing protein n=1 Tax=Tumebacillus flagellatus TaxID=1157490 RepID=A0A074M7P3_9BACL|nr:helix-turn-helix transcriptional regulator [Tumebacillus flagellatus]KEO82007.1 hypothetical protein EL26_17715 [Tumebacillus flagellatus]
MKVEVADLESITLGRRLKEILSDKGKAFSLRAMEMKTGISKDILLRIMKGERYFKPSEIELVAKAIDLTVDRFKGIDVQKKTEEITLLLSKRINLKRALQLAEELAPIAVGCTEKFTVHNYLGAVHFLLKNYEKALDAYVTSLKEARKLKELHGDSSPLYKAITNLTNTYIQMKDYPNAVNLLRQIQDDLEQFEPLWAGNLTFSEAMIAHSMGNLELCREKMYNHLKYYQQVGLPLQQGIGYQNVGYIEYLLGNYQAAKTFFELAIDQKKVAGLIESRLLSLKDYVKCLIKLKLSEQALRVIMESLEELEQLNLPYLKAKFLLLQSVIEGNICHAEEVLSMEDLDVELRHLACDFIMKHFAKIGDSIMLMKYYRIAEELKKSVTIDWEGI